MNAEVVKCLTLLEEGAKAGDWGMVGQATEALRDILARVDRRLEEMRAQGYVLEDQLDGSADLERARRLSEQKQRAMVERDRVLSHAAEVLCCRWAGLDAGDPGTEAEFAAAVRMSAAWSEWVQGWSRRYLEEVDRRLAAGEPLASAAREVK